MTSTTPQNKTTIHHPPMYPASPGTTTSMDSNMEGDAATGMVLEALWWNNEGINILLEGANSNTTCSTGDDWHSRAMSCFYKTVSCVDRLLGSNCSTNMDTGMTDGSSSSSSMTQLQNYQIGIPGFHQDDESHFTYSQAFAMNYLHISDTGAGAENNTNTANVPNQHTLSLIRSMALFNLSLTCHHQAVTRRWPATLQQAALLYQLCVDVTSKARRSNDTSSDSKDIRFAILHNLALNNEAMALLPRDFEMAKQLLACLHNEMPVLVQECSQSSTTTATACSTILVPDTITGIAFNILSTHTGIAPAA